MEGLNLPPTKNCVLTLCLYFSPYKSPHQTLPGGITSREYKREALYFGTDDTMLSYLSVWSGTETEKEGLIDKQRLLLGVRVPSPLRYVNVCGCAPLKKKEK